MLFGIAIILLQIMVAVHAARTGRLNPWVYIIIIVPLLGIVLYVIIELLPEWTNGPTARRIGSKAVDTVDPGRGYRALSKQVEMAPTVQNRLNLAEECLRLGRTQEALHLYHGCASGFHASDPQIRLGLARAMAAAEDYDGALHELDALRRDTPEHRSQDGHLLYAMALEGLGRVPEALEEYAALADYASGEEARCRYAALLAKSGDTQRAQDVYRDIVRRVNLQGRGYKRTQKTWYDTARRSLPGKWAPR